MLYEMDAALSGILMSESGLQENIQGLCKEILLEDALRSLAGISVDELKRSKAGIRTTVLKEAGYTDLYKLSQAADSELALIPGIGERQIEAIRNIIAYFINKL